MRESIFSSAIRSFFVALFAIIGIFLGIVPLIAIIIALTGGIDNEPESNFTPKVVANAEGKRKTLSSEAPVILKINVNGVIGTELFNMNTIRNLLVESREGTLKDNRVKAILLCINSPGGTVVDADGIYRAIKVYKEEHKVPVYAYIDGLCASGGMYVAAAADKVYSSNVSLIGSIGVISPSFLNFSKVMDKIGIEALTLFAGKGKDDLNPLRPWRPGEQDDIQNLINYFYDHFVNVMTSNRPALNKAKLVNEYGAKVFNPKEAEEHGFIDGSDASEGSTLKLLAKQIGIEDDYYQVVELQSNNWLAQLFSGKSELLGLFTGKVVHQVQVPGDLDARLKDQFLYLYHPE